MRYFLEVAYKGTNYSGFQSQKNANTIQAEIQKAFKIILKKEFELTGSSRTDAGVHAYQNYFHFDLESDLSSQLLYNLNAILPNDISVKNLLKVKDNAHCRFDAISREYKYHIYQKKDPFLATGNTLPPNFTPLFIMRTRRRLTFWWDIRWADLTSGFSPACIRMKLRAWYWWTRPRKT